MTEDLESRLAALDARLAALEARPPRPAQPPAHDFRLLETVRSIADGEPATGFAGVARTDDGELAFEWTRTGEFLMELDWASLGDKLTAIGHPLRLAILQQLLAGATTVNQLVDELNLTSTGTAYHHLSQMQAAGWVASPSRGTWVIPPHTVIPLLAILTALDSV